MAAMEPKVHAMAEAPINASESSVRPGRVILVSVARSRMVGYRRGVAGRFRGSGIRVSRVSPVFRPVVPDAVGRPLRSEPVPVRAAPLGAPCGVAEEDRSRLRARARAEAQLALAPPRGEEHPKSPNGARIGHVRRGAGAVP
jgi:hypothetical protein